MSRTRKLSLGIIAVMGISLLPQLGGARHASTRIDCSRALMVEGELWCGERVPACRYRGVAEKEINISKIFLNLNHHCVHFRFNGDVAADREPANFIRHLFGTFGIDINNSDLRALFGKGA